MKTPKQKGHQLRSVEISCHAADARSVFLAGTFNSWAPRRLPNETSRRRNVARELTTRTGDLRLQILVDGEWVCKPGMDELNPTLMSDGDCVPSVYGTANRRLEVD